MFKSTVTLIEDPVDHIFIVNAIIQQTAFIVEVKYSHTSLVYFLFIYFGGAII